MPNSSHHQASADIVATLKRWCTDVALPFWADTGFDHALGCFHEQLRFDGSADEAVSRRLFVQARQIYVFSRAAALGWYPEGAERAETAFRTMMTRFCADGRPGFAHRIKQDGAILDPRRDAYDHAFALLAMASLWQLRPSRDIGAAVAATLDFIDRELAAPDGTWMESIPPSLPRRQNPHMHAFEAMLALAEATAHPTALERVHRLHHFLVRYFYDPTTGTIREFFTDAWQPVPGPSGDTVEPGHLAEWAWLLSRFERLTGVSSPIRPANLLSTALRWSDTQSGLLFDEADRGGALRRDTRRLWPQTELAKAWIAEAERGVADAETQARTVLCTIRAQYLDRPFAGGWFDHCDRMGLPLTNFVPASALYHLFGAVAEADRVLGRGDTIAVR